MVGADGLSTRSRNLAQAFAALIAGQSFDFAHVLVGKPASIFPDA
jgi:hypothetical protein